MTQQLAAISEESIAAIKKAQTSGFTGSTGLVGIDLADVISLVPANTPLFDRTARKTPEMGAQFATWRALLNINNAQPNPFVGVDAGGNFILNSEQDMNAPYRPVRVSGQVTKDAIDLSRNYDDAKARSVASTMIQWRLQANRAMWGGQSFALPSMGAVTLTPTGGTTIPTGTAVRVQARSGLNYYWGGSGLASTNVTTGAAGGTVIATWASIKGAVAYDVFVNGIYYTTTSVNTVTITSVPGAAQPVPALPGVYSVAPTLNTASDTSYSQASYNGLIATLAGDVNTGGQLVTPGTGAFTSGATFASLAGAQMTANGQGVAEIDNMLLSIWNAAQVSPDVIWCNAQEAQSIANKVLSVNAAVTYLTPEIESRQGITAGNSVARYLNKAAGGAPVNIMVDPHLPPGRLVFATEKVPYPESGIVNTMEVRTLRDVSQTDYGPSLVAGTVGGGPREVFDVSSFETFIHRAPVACGVLTDIAAS